MPAPARSTAAWPMAILAAIMGVVVPHTTKACPGVYPPTGRERENMPFPQVCAVEYLYILLMLMFSTINT